MSTAFVFGSEPSLSLRIRKHRDDKAYSFREVQAQSLIITYYVLEFERKDIKHHVRIYRSIHLLSKEQAL